MQKAESMRSYAVSSHQATSPDAPVKRPRPALWVTLAALIVLIPLILVSATIILFQVFHLNLPGVVIFDQSVGLTSYDDTVAWINSYWNHARLITLSHPTDPNYAYIVAPQDLGYWVDPAATADAAYAIGRDSTPLQEISAALFGKTQVVLPVMYFDEDLARQTLESLAADLAVPPVEASVAYQDGAWVALPGSAGQNVDIDASLNTLYGNAFNIYLTQSVSLQMVDQPPAISDLTPLLADIENVVSKNLTFTAYDPINDESYSWSVPAEVKQRWVTINPETHEIGFSIDPDTVAPLVNAWEEEINSDQTLEINVAPSEVAEDWQNGESPVAIINHAPTTYQVSAGESLWSISLKLGMPMWHIMDANEGLTVDNLEAGMNLVIPSKNVLLPLPVVPNKRIVIDISSQRMTVYENGEVRSTYVVSTGIANSPTMAGIFQVQTHELNAYASNWDLYMPHFLGIYEAWPGFMNGIHGLPLLSSGQRLWASTLGSPASYGCIILDLAAAEDLYYWADPGVVVEITP